MDASETTRKGKEMVTMMDLTQRPKCKNFACGVNAAEDNAMAKFVSEIPVPDRLHIKPRSRIDAVKDNIPRPKRSVPPTAMPAWYHMSLDAKIPSLPGSDLFVRYTRGRIGDTLRRPSTKFDTSDPRNISGKPYTALHDPNAKDYLNKPWVKELLRKQGLVNEYDEVICSQKDFNIFRSSLALKYNQKVKEILQQQDKQAKVNRDQLRRIKTYERVTGSRDALNECMALLLEDSAYLEDYLPNRKEMVPLPN